MARRQVEPRSETERMVEAETCLESIAVVLDEVPRGSAESVGFSMDAVDAIVRGWMRRRFE